MHFVPIVNMDVMAPVFRKEASACIVNPECVFKKTNDIAVPEKRLMHIRVQVTVTPEPRIRRAVVSGTNRSELVVHDEVIGDKSEFIGKQRQILGTNRGSISNNETPFSALMTIAKAA
jgi:hypothetical protein